MDCVVLSGGTIEDTFAKKMLEIYSPGIVIAVDGGLRAADRLGIVPTHVVGDFDTADPGLVARYREIPGIQWEKHEPMKNDTDTDLAVSLVVRLGAKNFLVLGAFGGRMDHTLSNIHALCRALEAGVTGYLADGQNWLYLAKKQAFFSREHQFGRYISLIPFTEKVTGLTLEGFVYPLTDYTMRMGQRLGVSNELKEEAAQARWDEGILIVVESRDEEY